jgi:ribulose-phosphate 3-epimerase
VIEQVSKHANGQSCADLIHPKHIAMPPIRVLPSLLSADFARLAEELAACQQAGASMLHVDVMDGHFVPNLSLGPFIVEAMRRSTDLHLDVHLMMSDPQKYIREFRQAGSDAITIHVEAVGQRQLAAVIDQIRDSGAKVGLALNPDTDPTLWFWAFAKVDLVMFMTVYPGFGGQAFIPQVRPRIQATRAAFPQLDIQVDGGIARDTIPLVLADGANRLVCGSAYFKDSDKPGFIKWAESQRIPLLKPA